MLGPWLGFCCGFGLGKLKRLLRQEFSRHGSNRDGFLISGTVGTRCATGPPIPLSIRRFSRSCLAAPGAGGAGAPRSSSACEVPKLSIIRPG